VFEKMGLKVEALFFYCKINVAKIGDLLYNSNCETKLDIFMPSSGTFLNW